MSDDWEDWENQDFVVPVLSVPNEEQLKRLEERKLVEESDNALTNLLFLNEEEDLCLKQVEYKIRVKPLPKSEKEIKKNVLSKQKENEQKQKELSKKIKEEKLQKKKEKEIFGEAEEDEKYSKYEDMFY